MAQFPGYLRPETPAAASYRPGSVLDILGALGPRDPSPRRAVRPRVEHPRDRSSRLPDGLAASAPPAVVAAAAAACPGVGAPGAG